MLPDIYLDFNCNDWVLVKLTDYGRECLRKNRSDLGFPTYLPPEDSEGWSRWQLWALMSEFGEYLYLGAPQLPFECDIRIIKEPHRAP